MSFLFSISIDLAETAKFGQPLSMCLQYFNCHFSLHLAEYLERTTFLMNSFTLQDHARRQQLSRYDVYTLIEKLENRIHNFKLIQALFYASPLIRFSHH